MKPASHKLRVYVTLHTLNQGFEQVLTDFGLLEQLGFRREFLSEFRVIVEETRAWASFELVETMHEREERDWARFGRSRHQWDKKHRDPNDVLIEADRLKRKLRKATDQRAGEKKHRRKSIRKRVSEPGR